MLLTIQTLRIRNHCVKLKAIDWVGNVSMMSTNSSGPERYHILEGIFSQNYHAQEVPKCNQMHILSQNPHPCYMGEERILWMTVFKTRDFFKLAQFSSLSLPLIMCDTFSSPFLLNAIHNWLPYQQ